MRFRSSHRCGWLAALALYAGGGAAGVRAEPEPPPAPAAACTASIDGHVVDALTHEAIAGAAVRVGGRPVAETDAAGRFVLRGLCAGPLAVEVERAGYLPGQRTVELGAGTASLELELFPLDEEVIVVEQNAPEPDAMRSTAVLAGDALARTRGRGLAAAVAEVPGVTQLGSASGMAKPIIRGQFGRRLLLLVDGVRHRAQEWGLDHAPELDPFVADRIAVVRGADGVRYGPDAIGGAILADPPDLPAAPGYAGELHAIGASNGHGGNLAGRLTWAPDGVPGLAVRVDGSYKRLAAAATPDYALDNTGVAEWTAGATAGYRRGGTEYRLSYLRYQAELGVCSCLRIPSLDDFLAQLDRPRPAGADGYRRDFEIERPSQDVAHDLAIARARRRWDGVGALTATYAFQYDHRREYDVVRQATTGPQLDFRLQTHDVDLALAHRPLHVSDHLHLRGTAGLVGMAQRHRYGGVALVPDHTAWGAGVYALERLVGHDHEIEAGVRYDALARTASLERRDFLRLVRADQLAPDACGGVASADPVRCASAFHTVSASLGALRRLTDAWTVKLDLSTASRPPNPDEQYLNGTAPTSPVLGLGKPDLRPETTYSASVTTTLRTDRVTAEASAYANVIADYIYFAPATDANGAPIFDVLIRGTFPRFVTRAVDAVFYGADGGVVARPWPWLELAGQASLVRARTRDGAYLAFVPPDRYRGAVTVRRAALAGLRDASASITGTYAARQTRFDPAADLAPPPPAFFLLGAELGAETRAGDHPLRISVEGSNLTNARYREYTSLSRYFADQPGWQVVLRLRLTFTSVHSS